MEGRIVLVGEWDFPVPKTKEAVAAIDALELDGRIVVVLEHGDVHAERSFDNLRYVDLVENTQLTAYDVLCSDWVVFTDATLPGTASVVETFDPPLPPPVREGAPAAKGAAPEASALPAEKTAGDADTSVAAAGATGADTESEASESAAAEAGDDAIPSSAGEGDGEPEDELAADDDPDAEEDEEEK
jgi:hypothetical protein